MLPLLQDEKCREDTCTTGATCTGCVTLPSKNETALKIAVGSIGPISVGIDASEEAFQVRTVFEAALWWGVVGALFVASLWHVHSIMQLYSWTHLSFPPSPPLTSSHPPSAVQERSV